MVQEVNTEYGGAGNFWWGKPGDMTRRGIVHEAQPLVDKYLDPTPAIPPHTNADVATIDVLNDVIATYADAPQDDTMTSAPQIVFKPA